jgi:hypothetical protein
VEVEAVAAGNFVAGGVALATDEPIGRAVQTALCPRATPVAEGQLVCPCVSEARVSGVTNNGQVEPRWNAARARGPGIRHGP